MEPPMAKEPEQGLGCMLAIVCLGTLGVFPFLFGSMSQNLMYVIVLYNLLGWGIWDLLCIYVIRTVEVCWYVYNYFMDSVAIHPFDPHEFSQMIYSNKRCIIILK